MCVYSERSNLKLLHSWYGSPLAPLYGCYGIKDPWYTLVKRNEHSPLPSERFYIHPKKERERRRLFFFFFFKRGLKKKGQKLKGKIKEY